MRLGHNSTIIRREKICKSCGKLSYHFSKGRCQPCSTREDTLKKMEQETERSIQEDDLSNLIEDLDTLFSRYVRLLASDESGMGKCFICDKPLHYKEAQCMHYIGRSSLYLRWETKNCKSGCKVCNEYKGGNLIKYAERLEAQSNGITDILYQEGHIVYKPTKAELKALISEYSLKIKSMLNEKRKG